MNVPNRSHLDYLAKYIADSGWIKFREMNEFLNSRGISVNFGDEELRGEHIGLPHVWPETTLLGPTSQEYVRIVSELFMSYPVTLMIGDIADFAGDEPWWLVWVGPPLDGDNAPSKCPPVNKNVYEIADDVKYLYAVATQKLATMQYRLAELAGNGHLSPAESMRLQEHLRDLWEELYSGTLCAIRDWNTADDTWDWSDNTYSSGHQVLHQVRIEPTQESDDVWQHNRFLLGDGAPNEFPLGTVSFIARPRVEPDSAEPDDSGLVEDLGARLERYSDENDHP